MRLLFFLPLLSSKGGQERTLTDKANWLADKGHEVMMVTYENDGALAYPLDERILFTDLGCPYFPIYRQPFFRRFQAALKLKKLFRQKMAGVIKAFSPDVIVVTVPLTEFYLTDLMRTAGRVPIVIESHLAYGHEAIRRGFTEHVLEFFYPPIKAVSKSKTLVALTKGDAKIWRKYHHDVRVIPNPLTYYPPSISSCSSHLSPRIICVGRLSPQKRFDRMIDAFSLIADNHPLWHVDIFGDGEAHGLHLLQQRISDKGLIGRINIHSAVDDIYSQYQSSQFFVMSSDFEGFGLVIIEAMACGIPVVATDCPYGPSEIIDDGETGVLAKMDVQDLAEKMEWMMSHEAERKEMGIKARQAAARYKKEEIMKEWETVYGIN